MDILIHFTERGDSYWSCSSYAVGSAGELDIYQKGPDGTDSIEDTFAPGVWERVRVLRNED